METRQRALAAGIVAAVALSFGIGFSSDVRGFYGDPRFFESQPPVTNRLIHNVDTENYLATVLSQGSSDAQRQTVYAAVTAWNNALRGTPNSLTKYPIHFNGADDPNANLIVQFVDSLPAGCDVRWDACNDNGYPTTTISVKNTITSTPLLTHELGHSLWYSDQYNSDFTCSAADTIMNNNAPTCKQSITSQDKYDFLYRYNPTYVSPDAVYPHTWSASWNALYQVGSVRLYAPERFVEWKYYWQQFTDTGGSELGSTYTPKDQNYVEYETRVGSRYCLTGKIYNEVGYPGLQSYSPRSQYSCIGAAQQQNAGFFLATSDRSSPSSGALYIRIKNFSGGIRNLGIFGPSLQDIGCGYQNLAYLDTRACYISLGRQVYPYLGWFAWDASNNLSWGYLDFE